MATHDPALLFKTAHAYARRHFAWIEAHDPGLTAEDIGQEIALANWAMLQKTGGAHEANMRWAGIDALRLYSPVNTRAAVHTKAPVFVDTPRRKTGGLDRTTQWPNEPFDLVPVEDFSEQVSTIHDISRAVAHLPEPLRDLVVRWYYQGETLLSIGKSYGITEGAVSHRLARAAKLLRRYLHAYAESSGQPQSHVPSTHRKG